MVHSDLLCGVGPFGMSISPSYPPHVLGRRGEGLAAQYLEDAGWVIEARNFRFGRKEVDLVARKDGLTAFVEVKTRAGSGFGGPLAAVTGRKRREIEVVAARFLATGPMRDHVRFDVIAIQVDRRGRVVSFEHLEDAWRPGWP